MGAQHPLSSTGILDYYPDPDYGIYLIKSKKIEGPWTTPVLVAPGKGLIDPCPLWDDNGKLYLVHAYAGSRAGIKSVLVVNELSADGSAVITDPVLVYDGHETDPTVEGPKFYKRNGYYYIFAPAGGVSTGWQLVLRSKNVYGPYERKVVMDQGQTAVNGPHQGAWVDTRSGENWFLHFQDKAAYGRVVHLQPMRWVNDWPVIGNDIDGNGKGEPVMLYKKPNVGGAFPLQTPVASDEFENRRMGLQWQWQANPAGNPAFIYNGHLRLFAAPLPDSFKNYWTVPSLLLQKFTADSFTATTAIYFHPKKENDRAGLIVFGSDYAMVSLSKKPTGNFLSLSVCIQADKGAAEKVMAGVPWTGDTAYCRVTVKPGGICHFSYSSDNIHYHSMGDPFVAKPGRWVGAKLGIFCSSLEKTNDAGYADFDWFRITPAE